MSSFSRAGQKSQTSYPSAHFSQVWTRHLAGWRTVAWVYAPFARRWVDLGSGAGFPEMVVAILLAEMQGRAEVQCLESDQRKCAFLRGVARATDAPARMAVVLKCSILAGCHLWTQSPPGHGPPCLVSLNLPMNCLCSARSEIYRGDDRRQHRLKPTFSVASQFQFKSFRNNFDPDARIDCVDSRDSHAQAQK